jgi:hypothetical protein
MKMTQAARTRSISKSRLLNVLGPDNDEDDIQICLWRSKLCQSDSTGGDEDLCLEKDIVNEFEKGLQSCIAQCEHIAH